MIKAYEPYTMTAPTRRVVDQCNEIIEYYQERKLLLTLRQLYYQMVSKDLIPNTTRSYNRLGDIVSKARMQGIMDWSAIEDRDRTLTGNHTYTDPGHFIDVIRYRYHEDPWRDCLNHVEVWVEKKSLVSIVGRASSNVRVDYMACKGYMSQSAMYNAGQRFKRRWRMKGQRTTIIHIGDHDPSGIDMTRDNLERARLFADGAPVEIDRIALNWEQIIEHEPPPNPAKQTDSRFRAYNEEYGDKSWEVDALDPETLQGLVEDAVMKYITKEDFDAHIAAEKRNDERLAELSDRWPEVEGFLEYGPGDWDE